MRAIIPVAGVGSRLRPHTYSLPKVLLNVGGKPILGHLLDRLIEQGINKATIITGYMGKLVQKYVRKNYDIDVDFVSQRESLGLGHAIWTAKETFGDDSLLIALGDTIFDADLSFVFDSKFATICVKEVDDPRRFGVVKVNGRGQVKKFIEKPEKPVSNLAIVGIYYFPNPHSLAAALEEIVENNIKTKNEYQLTDALQLMLDKGETFKTTTIEGWYDCGKPETMLATNKYLLKKNNRETANYKGAVIIPPVFIGKDVVIKRSVIGPNVTVANGTYVQDSVVKDSIISDGAIVEKSLLSKSIIGNNAIVRGNFVTLNVGNSSEIYYK
jgi:glucose-1-phosphate thymidylyltransferase